MCIKPSPCSPLLSAKSSFSSWEEHQPLHLQSHQVSKGHTDVEVRALPQSTSVSFLIFTKLLLPWLSPGSEGGAGREQAGQASWRSPPLFSELSHLPDQTCTSSAFLLIPLRSHKLPGPWSGYAVCLSGLARLSPIPLRQHFRGNREG